MMRSAVTPISATIFAIVAIEGHNRVQRISKGECVAKASLSHSDSCNSLNLASTKRILSQILFTSSAIADCHNSGTFSSENPNDALLNATPAPPATCNTYREDVMGVDFPTEIEIYIESRLSPKTETLLAAAPKCFKDLCWLPMARAFSLGVYVNKEKVRSKFGDTFHKDPSVCFNTDVEKTMRLVFVSGKNKNHIIEGFGRALTRGVSITGSPSEIEEGHKNVAKFKEMIKGLPFSKGCVLTLLLNSDATPGKLTILFSPNEVEPPVFVGEIDGKSLLFSFHNLYFRNVADGSEPEYAFVAKKLAASFQANKSNF
ncbi:hypothetical protein IE077_001244 [Cardiosporidium cionae]|uniref:Uncharacterized protein n=1 Tax=Cardiosporidium cionae TaxID=476202 RepID=A0ABQ7J5Q6_9APIC|nr:hypothetical protein IE077_001244 [Cardiosporidium cionae]|eukprot:KAF8819285.1 hypothetical protein IE077_001244 [Cardiosporidium cionae]